MAGSSLIGRCFIIGLRHDPILESRWPLTTETDFIKQCNPSLLGIAASTNDAMKLVDQAPDELSRRGFQFIVLEGTMVVRASPGSTVSPGYNSAIVCILRYDATKREYNLLSDSVRTALPRSFIN